MADGLDLVCRDLTARGLMPETGPDRVAQTHISWVILTGDRAYKVKKPVRFPFLDYSTPALRRLHCATELALGRRLTPELYLGLVDASGETALAMHRFPDGALLADLAAAGQLTDALVDALADEVAVVHARCPPVPPARAIEQLSRQQRSSTQDFAEMRELASGAPVRAALDYLDTWRHIEYRAIEDRSLARARRGRVRELHGDLHLGNLVLLHGRPRLFDPIEFNDDFRMIDVASDLAFLAMDLEARDHAGASRRLVERYVEATGDAELPALLPYHMVQRALVRAKVAMLSRDEPGIDRYLRLACALAAKEEHHATHTPHPGRGRPGRDDPGARPPLV